MGLQFLLEQAIQKIPRMKELFRERDLTRVHYYQSILEAAGIPTFLRNENVSTTRGVSIPDFFPALCVVDDADYEQAVEVIKADVEDSSRAPTEDVLCPHCGESCPGSFGRCWNCQASLGGGS